MESRITTIGEMMCILVANNGSIVCRITDALDFALLGAKTWQVVCITLSTIGGI